MTPKGDVERLEALIGAIPAEELATLVGRRRFYALHKLVSREPLDDVSEAVIAQYAVALDGRGLLAEPAILAALLCRLDPQELREIAKRHLEQPFNREADNAIALASKPLRMGSSRSRDILGALGLSDAVLEDVERKAAVEMIEPYAPLPPLFDYQSEVRTHCMELLKLGIDEFLIQMPTGSGKTRTAMELVVDIAEAQSLFVRGKSVVWLAHTEELCEQAIDAFSSVWAMRGMERVRVARLWGGYSPSQADLSGALIVAGTSKVHGLRRSDGGAMDNLAAKCAVVIVDEAHRALAPTVRAQIATLRSKENTVLIGLSATPARSTGPSPENAALAKLFGRNLVTPSLGDDPIGELRKRGILAELERVEIRYAGSISDLESLVVPPAGSDDDLPESVLERIAGNVERNLAIITELESRVSSLEPAIVFCCSVLHSELLSAALRLRGVRAATVDCRMGRTTRRLVIQKFARGELDVLLNFGVLSTGFDAPNVRTVVIARPTKSMILYSQMLGRGLRGPRMGGTALCTLIDVRDHLGRFGDLSDLYLRFSPYWAK